MFVLILCSRFPLFYFQCSKQSKIGVSIASLTADKTLSLSLCGLSLHICLQSCTHSPPTMAFILHQHMHCLKPKSCISFCFMWFLVHSFWLNSNIVLVLSPKFWSSGWHSVVFDEDERMIFALPHANPLPRSYTPKPKPCMTFHFVTLELMAFCLMSWQLITYYCASSDAVSHALTSESLVWPVMCQCLWGLISRRCIGLAVKCPFWEIQLFLPHFCVRPDILQVYRTCCEVSSVEAPNKVLDYDGIVEEADQPTPLMYHFMQVGYSYLGVRLDVRKGQMCAGCLFLDVQGRAWSLTLSVSGWYEYTLLDRHWDAVYWDLLRASCPYLQTDPNGHWLTKTMTTINLVSSLLAQINDRLCALRISHVQEERRETMDT